MITIRLNEKIYTIEPDCSHVLDDILVREGYTSPYFAVAVNKQFIPREEYENTFLKEGDCVEVVTPMQGG